MGIEEHKKHAPKNLNCAVITVSSSRTKENDESGRAVLNILEKHGNTVAHYELVKDEIIKIRETLDNIIEDKDVDAVFLNGGTGISKNDVTIEAVKPYLDKELKGFGELFRLLSFKEIGSPAMLSRALAGVGKGKIIICLPGSTNACTMAMEKLIIPELGHLVYEVGR
ncbi:MAG: MogA/MoaB family molybdenum cofactor biosynthesis protein [Thermoplasmata archaeon]|nr:MAG: MogA/MoaB family molybdenum cofactor biosynthesis protein [Thermoplasmata archaeon]